MNNGGWEEDVRGAAAEPISAAPSTLNGPGSDFSTTDAKQLPLHHEQLTSLSPPPPSPPSVKNQCEIQGSTDVIQSFDIINGHSAVTNSSDIVQESTEVMTSRDIEQISEAALLCDFEEFVNATESSNTAVEPTDASQSCYFFTESTSVTQSCNNMLEPTSVTQSCNNMLEPTSVTPSSNNIVENADVTLSTNGVKEPIDLTKPSDVIDSSTNVTQSSNIRLEPTDATQSENLYYYVSSEPIAVSGSCDISKGSRDVTDSSEFFTSVTTSQSNNCLVEPTDDVTQSGNSYKEPIDLTKSSDIEDFTDVSQSCNIIVEPTSVSQPENNVIDSIDMTKPCNSINEPIDLTKRGDVNKSPTDVTQSCNIIQEYCEVSQSSDFTNEPVASGSCDSTLKPNATNKSELSNDTKLCDIEGPNVTGSNYISSELVAVSGDVTESIELFTSVTSSHEEVTCKEDRSLDAEVVVKLRERLEDTTRLLNQTTSRLERSLEEVGRAAEERTNLHRQLEEVTKERDGLVSLARHTAASLKKQLEDGDKDKEKLVMRYAKSEKELLDSKKDTAALNKQLKEEQREKEKLGTRLKNLTDDKARLSQALDNKNSELSSTRKEIDKLKEDINSRDIKIKWIQNKLLGEMDLHKECPERIEELKRRVGELEATLERTKEENQQYQKDLQHLQAVKLLEREVREEQAKLMLERHDQSEKGIRLKALELKTEQLIEENNRLTLEMERLEGQRAEAENRLGQLELQHDKEKRKVAEFEQELAQLHSVSQQLRRERERAEQCEEEVGRGRRSLEEVNRDLEASRSHEAELLHFTQQLTSKNVQLQAHCSDIEARAGELMLKAEEADELKSKIVALQEKLDTQRREREEERGVLAREVATERSRSSGLEAELRELKATYHSSSNKHQALIKELQRELQVCHRKLEEMEVEGVSESGRGGVDDNGRLAQVPDAAVIQPSHLQMEVSPSVLVERIVRLQTEAKAHRDKIEFLEDHVNSLTEELQRKGRLIAWFLSREPVGALASQASDRHKREVCGHGGIMASVYGSKATDEGLTLELSLEMNHRLQAVLEDTLLKNITLKENIDTLGDEIERLKTLKSS